MMKMKWINTFFVFLIGYNLSAQVTNAKIIFERKTNLFKKYKGERTKDWIKEENKIKIDVFELIISDSLSVFKPQESDIREQMDWLTQKNTTYHNLNSKTRFLIKNMWGEELYLKDSIIKRTWKITDGTRKIAGYNCRKAIWQANDTTKIYAWFSYDLTPSVGPESYTGLPGTILGLATEDGGVIYFAKKIELQPLIAASDLQTPKKKKVKTISEVKLDMESRFGKEKWFKPMWDEQFLLW
ncbi:MAG: GLPGLI family protein [Bacteroidetes bacterium]|nr:GLPGLI family protein [Bacteroidota bacterium]